MHGIVGFIDKSKKIETLERMLKAQLHRGTHYWKYCDDKSGVHLGSNYSLIKGIDLDYYQPLHNIYEGCIIAFDGNIYNLPEIKTELLNLGYKITTNCSYEVIVQSYNAWGIKCLSKFNGAFSLAVFDKYKNKIYLARDRAGIKPLYYYKTKSQFVFASEIKSFHRNPNFTKTQDLEVLPYYFQFGYIPAPYTIFKNCFKLEAGHYLEFDIENLELEIIKYWDVNGCYIKEKSFITEDEILSNIETMLDDAILSSVASRTNIGVFLSGGYDSSLITSLLAKKHRKKINTFTIGFKNEKYNEAVHAKTVAEYLDTNHTEYYISGRDVLDLVKTVPFYYDEPFADSSALPTMMVSKLATNSVDIAISADGGDEIFCGYSKYFFLNKIQHVFSNRHIRNLMRMGLNIINPSVVEYINNTIPKNIRQTNIHNKYKKFSSAINSETLEEMFENASSHIDRTVVSDFLKIKKNVDYFKKWGKINDVEFLEQMMAIDYKLLSSDDVLVKVNRAAISAALEVAEPLLDHRLIEYLAKVPSSIKHKNNQSKYLQRQILYKYLPKELVDKPKSGFQAPLDQWLRNELKELVLVHLDDTKLDKNIFDTREIHNIKKRFFNGEKLETIIWFVVMYQMWKEMWLE